MKTQINFTMSDNKQIYGYIWKSETVEATKSIVICHGMAEHIDRYEKFCELLSEAGFIVLGYNQRGHKYTSDENEYGYMGNLNNFEILVDDLYSMVNYLKSQYNFPVYLFGHSMGSFVCTRFIELHSEKISKVVLCGTGRNPNLILRLGAFIASIIALFKGKQYRSKLIDSMSFGAFNSKFKPNRTDFDWLNSVNEEVDKYINDKYCGGIFTVKYFHDFFKGCIKVTNNLKQIKSNIPILLISGNDDPVGNMGKSVTKVYNNLSKINSNVTIKLIPNERHEILLEKSKEVTQNFIINWLVNNK